MDVVHPVGSLQVLVWMKPSAEARCPLIVIAFYSSVVIGDLVRDSYRDSVSRILDGNGVVASCGWMGLGMKSNEVG